MRKKRKKWMKFRHKVVRNVAYWFLYPYAKWKYGVTIEPLKDQEKRPYLILLNHQTVFDQFFVGMAFKGPVYYVATEDIFSNGWVSYLIRYIVAPIPIKKQTTDIQAVRNCVRVAKEGGTIAIAPEGNRTYSGRTEYMNPAIAGLAKTLGLPIAFFRIEGGYGVQPRWCDDIRKGKMRAYFSKVVQPEEYKSFSNEELYELIQKELYVDETEIIGEYHHKNTAQYLERLLYVCPNCGLSEFESHEDTIRCKKCNCKMQYLPTKVLKGIGFDSPFGHIAEWYDYQKEFMNQLDLSDYDETPLYCDRARFIEVIVYKKKQVLRKEAKVTLYGNRVVIDEGCENSTVFSFDEITAISVLGRNKANIYHDKHVYQLKGDKRFNAIKYVHIYYRYRNMNKGEGNEQFLGL